MISHRESAKRIGLGDLLTGKLGDPAKQESGVVTAGGAVIFSEEYRSYLPKQLEE